MAMVGRAHNACNASFALHAKFSGVLAGICFGGGVFLPQQNALQMGWRVPMLITSIWIRIMTVSGESEGRAFHSKKSLLFGDFPTYVPGYHIPSCDRYVMVQWDCLVLARRWT